MFLGTVGFGSQVLALWGKRGSTGLKLRHTITKKRKLREVVRKKGKVSPKVQNRENVDWLNGLLL